MDSSSSDSDAGEKIKNIHSVLVKSASSHQEGDKRYAYKRKLGDLVFNANFEAGNLGHVERINRYEYDLMVRPDVANPRSRLWFNFTVSNQSPNQCIFITFVNLSDKTKLFHEGLTPVVRSRQKPNWQRLHEDQVFYHKSPDHGDRYVLSIAFRFSSYENEHQFATFYPYSCTNLMNFITRWTVEIKREQRNRGTGPENLKLLDNKSQRMKTLNQDDDDQQLRTRSTLGFGEKTSHGKEVAGIGEDVEFECSLLGVSILSKPIYQLSIKGTSKLNSKPKVVVLCRLGGNVDSVSSLVCQGLLDYMLCNNLIARVARQFVDFECIALMDPDSSYVGNSETDLMGQTSVSARMMRTSKFVYSNLLAIQESIEKVCNGADERVILLELKVNLNLIGSRIVGTRYSDPVRMERHLTLPRLLARFASDFYLENCVFLSRFSRSSTIPFDFGSHLNVDQYRLEVSPFAFYKRSIAQCKYEEYHQKQYLSLGKAVVYSLLELLRPKEQSLPYCAATILDSFQSKANDIDDLMLRLKQVC